MNTSHFPDGFEKLILSKTYQELSASELNQLSQEKIMEDEYIQIRKMLSNMEHLEEDMPTPSEKLKTHLLAAFDEEIPHKNIFLRFPLFSLIAVAAIILIAVVGIIKPFEKESTNELAIVNQSSESEKKNEKMQEEVVVPQSQEPLFENGTSKPMVQSSNSEVPVIANLSATMDTAIADKSSAEIAGPNSNVAELSRNMPTMESLKKATNAISEKHKIDMDASTASSSLKDNLEMLNFTVEVF